MKMQLLCTKIMDAAFHPPLKPTLFQRVSGKKIGFGMFFVREILSIYGFTITETGTPGKGVQFEIIVPAGSFRIVKQIPQ